MFAILGSLDKVGSGDQSKAVAGQTSVRLFRTEMTSVTLALADLISHSTISLANHDDILFTPLLNLGDDVW